ncbi:MAG: FAD-containing oxidoreductase [Cyclobacteriaceae bacterium]
MKEFDIIIIGTGQAGPSIAFRCAGEGLKTAIIEKGNFGGECVNTGCTPTKTLVSSARAAFMARKAEDYGVEINGTVQVDMKKVKARKDEIVIESREGLEDRLKDEENLTVIEGHARFVDNHTVEVNGEKLSADKIFINVGTRPNVPEEYKDVEVLTNRSIMEIDFIPEHLVVVGGSYIGIEFAQMYRRFGSKVTIIEKSDRLAAKEDEDISEEIQSILESEGITIRLNANCLSAKMKDGKIIADLDCEEDAREVEGSHLLLAIGRNPNTDDLGLQNTDIELSDDGFIRVNNQCETKVKGVWAVGDCNGEGAFTHTAVNDADIVTGNLFDGLDKKISDRIECYGLYMDPPMARVGFTEAQVKKAGLNAKMATRTMDRIARAKEKGETKGKIKILADADTDKFLGVTILGVGGDEVIHLFIDMMYADMPYTIVKNAVHIHPTVSELIPTILGEFELLD